MIDVVIVNFKSTGYLIRCLASIEKTHDRHRPAIYVEDNASDRSIDQVADQFSSVHIDRHRRNLGFAAAVNRALSRSRSPFVVLLNPDARISDGFFDSVMDYMAAHPEVGIIGPRILDADGALQGSARRFPNALTAMFGRNSLLTRWFPNNRISRTNILTIGSDGRTPMTVDWVSGACMVVRRSAIDTVGLLDERFFMYWEDADWCRRMWEHQWRVVYLPTTTVSHAVGGSSARSVFLSVLRFHLSAYRLFAKHHTQFPVVLLKPLVAVGLTARLSAVQGMWAGRWLWRRFRLRYRWTSRSGPPTRKAPVAASYRIPMGHSEAISLQPQVFADPKPAKRLLILNQYYPPDRSATAVVLAQIVSILSRRFQVTVLAGRPSYRPIRLSRWRPAQVLKGRRATIIRLGSTAFSRYRMAGRALNYLTYMAWALPVAMVVRTEIVMAMTDPPLAGMVGAAVSWIRQKPFIYNIQDLHPDMAIAAGMIRSGGLVKVWEWLHRWALRRADRIIVLGEDMRRRVIQKGIAPDRILVIRSGSEQPMHLPGPDDPIVQRLRGGRTLNVVHAGNLGHYGAWDTFIRAFSSLPNNGVGLLFVGDGAAKRAVMAAAANTPAIRFLPFEPRAHLPHVMAAGDLQVISIRRGMEGMIVPSKFYSVLSSGRPVLAVASKDTDVSQIVTRYGCGIVVEPDDPMGLAAAIRNISKDPSRLVKMGCQSRCAALELARAGQLALMEKEIEALLGAR